MSAQSEVNGALVPRRWCYPVTLTGAGGSLSVGASMCRSRRRTDTQRERRTVRYVGSGRHGCGAGFQHHLDHLDRSKLPALFSPAISPLW